MEKKKDFSVLKFIISLICVIFIVISVAVNILFSASKTPKLFGRYIYIVTENDTASISDVTPGAAILAKEASDISIALKDIVLCYPAGDPENLRLCGIYKVVDSEGTEKYQTYFDGHEDNTDLITKDKIAAVCTGYPESLELGNFLNFTKSVTGILTELILPCIILVIFLIAKIASSKNKDDEENNFYEYEGSDKHRDNSVNTQKGGSPLFEPKTETAQSDELERKKQSITENFSQKKVDPDSPYQKEKERTMQFKAQRAEANSYQKSAAMPGTVPNVQNNSQADNIKEEMLRKTAEAERTGSLEMKQTSVPHQPVQPSNSIPENTGILSKAEVDELVQNTVPSERSAASKTEIPHQSTSPDISDIIGKADLNTRKKHANEMSIDDLLKIIEDEKKKL